MQTPRSIDDAIAFFHKEGVKAVRSYPYKPCDPMHDGVAYVQGSGLVVSPSIIPVYAAALLGFSTPLLAEVIERSGMDARKISSYLELNGTDTHQWSPTHSMDPVEFVKRVVEGFAYLIRDEGLLKDQLISAMEGHSIVGLAVMPLGIPGLDVNASIDAELEAITNPPNGSAGYSMEGRIHYIGDILWNLKKESHFPNGNARDFLEMSGSLRPEVIRKNFGSSFWDDMIGQAKKEFEIFHELIKSLVEYYPEKATIILKSLDFSSVVDFIDLDYVNYTYSVIEGALERKGLGSTKEDLSYKIGRISGFLRDNEDIHLGSSAPDIDRAFMLSGVEETFNELVDLDTNLYGEVMRSHMGIDPENITTTQFKAWNALKRLRPTEQSIESKVLSEYLAHMAKAAQSLYPSGHENIVDYRESIIDPINDSMSALVAQYRNSIDYSSLKNLDENKKSVLSQWGLGLRELGVKNEKTIEQRIGTDLGL